MKHKKKITKFGHMLLLKEYESLQKDLQKSKLQIQQAKEHGDFSENAELDSARNDFNIQSARLVELENELANAEVVEPTSSAMFEVGSLVRLERFQNNAFVPMDGIYLLDSKQAPYVIDTESPLGKQILGNLQGIFSVQTEYSDEPVTFRVTKSTSEADIDTYMKQLAAFTAPFNEVV